MLDAFTARRMFDYNPVTGQLKWKWHPRPVTAKRYKGQDVGRLTSRGYRQVNFSGRFYHVSRVIYLIMMGHFPFNEVDHRNGDKDDNRWSNLRPATRAQNCSNRSAFRSNALGLKGVHRHGNKFMFALHVDGKRYSGLRDTAAEAKAARDALAKKLHGEFFRV